MDFAKNLSAYIKDNTHGVGKVLAARIETTLEGFVELNTAPPLEIQDIREPFEIAMEEMNDIDYAYKALQDELQNSIDDRFDKHLNELLETTARTYPDIC